MNERALVVEDDEDLAKLLQDQLSGLGFEIDWAADGRSGLQKSLENDYAFVILDLMLPELEGTEVCRKLREEKPQQPIIVLTGKSDELSKVLLLELGADDYVTKPFSNMELKARVSGVLRRKESYRQSASQSASEQLEVIRCGDIVIDHGMRTLSLKGEKLDLTTAEFDVLALLASQPGRVFNKEEMAEAIHGFATAGCEASITSLVNRIRAKLEPKPSKPIYLQTVRGVGYRLMEHSSE